MLSNTPTDPLTREEHAEAVVIRIGIRSIHGLGDESALIREALYREAETVNLPLILDLSDVHFLSSIALGWLIVLRNRLVDRGMPFEQKRQRWEVFALFPDQAAAIEAIRRGEHDSLMLCGVRREVREVFAIC